MARKITIITIVIIISLFVLGEIITPIKIEQIIEKEMTILGVEHFEYELLSSPSHIFNVITNNIHGKVIVYDFDTTVNFERVELNFTNWGLKEGNVEFIGFVNQEEISRFLKAQWDDRIDIVLSDKRMGVSIPVDIAFMTINANITGDFKVMPKNQVEFVVENVKIDLPGPSFEKQIKEYLLKNYKLDFSLESVPYVKISQIDIKEGYLIIGGVIH